MIFEYAKSTIKSLYNKLLGRVGSTDRNGRTRLHNAIEIFYLPRYAPDFNTLKKEITDLIAEGENPNAKDNKGMTPLHWAVYRSTLEAEIVSLLIEKGALPNAKDKIGYQPLHYAAMLGKVYVAKELLSNPIVKNQFDITPILPQYYARLERKAMKKGDVKFVNELRAYKNTH